MRSMEIIGAFIRNHFQIPFSDAHLKCEERERKQKNVLYENLVNPLSVLSSLGAHSKPTVFDE